MKLNKKIIPNTKNLYEADEQGNIYSIRTGAPIIKYLNHKGYHRVGLYLYGNGKRKLFFVHRLIMNTFRPISEHKPINHINGIKTDNLLTNLEWTTPSENMKHSWNNFRKRERSGRIVLDLSNGIYYSKAKDAAFSKQYKSKTLVNMLSGHRKNTSSFIYV